MGKRVIPEQVTNFCDRCKKETGMLDLKITADFTGRDWHGCAVGGVTRHIEMCSGCMIDFELFMKPEQEPESE